MPDHYRRIAAGILAVTRDLGSAMEPGMQVLDFGCGRGNLVSAFSELGLDAYGADVRQCWEDANGARRLRVISVDPYEIPFEADRFDLVTSTSVVEHIRNPEACLGEIFRVLKPGGSTVHLFPGPWHFPLEPHTGIPLGGVIQSRLWLAMWARLGARNKHQQGMGWRRVLEMNLDYMKTGLNYMPRKRVEEVVTGVFGNCTIAKTEYVRHWPGGAAELGRKIPIPGYPSLLFTFREGLVVARKGGR